MIMGVPYDAEVEYLESYTQQSVSVPYIDTAAQDADHYLIEWMTDSAAADIKIFGNSYAYGRYRDISIYGGQYRGTSIATANSTWDIIEIDIPTNKLRVSRNGAVVGTATAWWAAKVPGGGNTTYGTALPLFAHNNEYGVWVSDNRIGNWTNKYRVYISRFQAWRNGVLVRNFIPVRVGQVGYMYDRVSKKLFGNQGTGSFILGPDVAKPVMGIWRYRDFYFASDYIRNGLIAMWDGIENAGWGQHDPNATVWKDLVGDMSIQLLPTSNIQLFFDTNCLTYQDSYNASLFPTSSVSSVKINNSLAAWYNGQFGTLEMVVYWDKPITNCRLYTLVGWINPSNSLWYEGNIFTNNGFSPVFTNGVASSLSFTLNKQYKNGIISSSNTLSLRAHSYTDATVLDWFYRGNYQSPNIKTYAIRFYNRALTADEIAYNYMIDKARFNLP